MTICVKFGFLQSLNKKVLREYKRHTVRRVASTHCAAVSGGGGDLLWMGVSTMAEGQGG